MLKPHPHQFPTLNELLEERGISKVELSHAAEVHENTLRRWQSGTVIPRIDLAIKVSAILGVSLKTFCRSIGLDVNGLPDDVATSSLPPLDLNEVIADAERTLETLKALAAKK